MFSHILVPIDGSPISIKAARGAIALARQVGARLTIYHAIDPIPYGFSAKGAPEGDSVKKELERRARQAGEKFVGAVAQAAERAGVACRCVVEVAGPEEGIIANVHKRKCDAILMAPNGLRGIKRLLLGSVTSRILAKADVPVIVYR
jgi:nucleotide-binding universal stress UspA family protein